MTDQCQGSALNISPNMKNIPEANGCGRVLALSTSAFTLLFAVWLMFGILGVPIGRELQLSQVQFVWLGAIAVLNGSLWRLPFGILTDRIGGRLVFTLLLLATAIPCYLVSTAHSFTELMICSFLLGIAGNSFSCGIAWNAAWFPFARQGVALGTFGAGNVGASITKMFAPHLITLVPIGGLCFGWLPDGWRSVPVIYSVLLVMMAATVWFFAPADRRPARGRPMKDVLAPLKEMRVWRFGLYYVVVFGAYVALSLTLPKYYVDVYGLDLTTAGLLTALFIFPASLLRPLGGWLSDRFGARIVTYAVFAAMFAACVPLALPNNALGWQPSIATFTLLVVVIGVGMGLGKASVYKYIPEYFPQNIGAVGGLVGCLGALGGFVLPLGFGYLRQATGIPQTAFMLLGSLILASFCWLHFIVLGIKRRTGFENTPVAQLEPVLST